MSDTPERVDHAAAMILDRRWNAVWKQLERDVNLAAAHVHDRTWIEIAYRVVEAAKDQGIVVDAAERDGLAADLARVVAYARRLESVLRSTEDALVGDSIEREITYQREKHSVADLMRDNDEEAR